MTRRECKWTGDRADAWAITDLWWAWSRGELTFAQYLELAMVAVQAAAEEPGSSEDHEER